MSLPDSYPDFVYETGTALASPPPAAPPPAAPPPKRRGWILPVAVAGVVALAVVVAIVVALVISRSASPSTPTATMPSAPVSTQPSPEPTPVAYTGGITPTILWAKVYGGEAYDMFNAVTVTADGSIIAAGYTRSMTGDFGSTYGTDTAVVAMFDGQGNIEWATTFADEQADEFKGVAIGQDGSIYAVGSSVASDKGSVVVKLTPAGDIVWVRAFGGSGIDIFWGVVADGDGIIVAGYTDSTDGDIPATHGELDALLASITQDGDIAWAKTFGGSKDDVFYSVTIGVDGAIVAAGFSKSHDGDFADPRGDSNALIASFSAAGELTRSKVFGGGDTDLFNAISTAPDGSYFIGGGTWSMDGDLPHVGPKFSITSVYGMCSNDLATCRWEAGSGGDLYGATVTDGGVGVSVGGENWLMGVQNLNTTETVSGQAIPVKYQYGTYQGVAALPNNQVVAVGVAQTARVTDVLMGQYDAVIVVIGFQ